MRTRIGHAAHGLDNEALDIAESLAREDLVMIEFNPDSNIALNNIDTAEELEMVKCLDRAIPFVICSDGGGLFQTDIWQLDDTVSFAGLNEHHIDTIVAHEDAHIARECARFERKLRSLPLTFIQDITGKIDQLPTLVYERSRDLERSRERFEQHLKQQKIEFSSESVEEATSGKRPLLILGASGARWWDKISRLQQSIIRDLVQGLVSAIDPRNCYLMIGRPKNAGITTALSNAVVEHNSAIKEIDERISLISATVQADQTLLSFTPGLTHLIPLWGGLFTVPHQLVDYVAERDGVVVFIGGGTFVRDAILVARERGVTSALMNGPEGASTDKSVMFDSSKQFRDLAGLLEIINASGKGMLRSRYSQNL
jgi:hypothetical protein